MTSLTRPRYGESGSKRSVRVGPEIGPLLIRRGSPSRTPSNGSFERAIHEISTRFLSGMSDRALHQVALSSAGTPVLLGSGLSLSLEGVTIRHGSMFPGARVTLSRSRNAATD